MAKSGLECKTCGGTKVVPFGWHAEGTAPCPVCNIQFELDLELDKGKRNKKIKSEAKEWLKNNPKYLFGDSKRA